MTKNMASGVNVIKLFSSSLKVALSKLVFVHAKFYKPSLIFVSKAESFFTDVIMLCSKLDCLS